MQDASYLAPSSVSKIKRLASTKCTPTDRRNHDPGRNCASESRFYFNSYDFNDSDVFSCKTLPNSPQAAFPKSSVSRRRNAHLRKKKLRPLFLLRLRGPFSIVIHMIFTIPMFFGQDASKLARSSVSKIERFASTKCTLLFAEAMTISRVGPSEGNFLL